MKLYHQIHLDLPCLYPCKYLSNFGLTYSPYDSEDGGELREIFLLKKYAKQYKSVYTYKALDLFAALGGYIGIFLGFSIFDIRQSITNLIHRFLKNDKNEEKKWTQASTLSNPATYHPPWHQIHPLSSTKSTLNSIQMWKILKWIIQVKWFLGLSHSKR